ncbi:MAG: peroxide stress protein YaaA [Clostridium sp.]
MITLLSPTKGLNFHDKIDLDLQYTEPMYFNEVQELILELEKYEISDLMKLMNISETLAILNFTRFQDFDVNLKNHRKAALFSYEGEAYKAMDPYSLNKDAIEFSQSHLRILSGLYGILRPLDLIKEYRLEMLIKLPNSRGKNLYEYWGESIKDELVKEIAISNEKVLINLASDEYSKAARVKDISKEFRVVTPVFKELKGGVYKVITVYAKRARGLMTRFIMENKIDKVEDLKKFSLEDYEYNELLSIADTWVFTR